MVRLGTYLLSGFLRLLGLLPLKVHYAFGAFLSFLAEKVVRYRRSDVMINLSRSFPEKKYGELKKISHSFYRHFGDLLAEAVWFGGCRNPERLKKSGIVRILNPEVLNDYYEKSPSVMVMYSHCGNWELFGGIGSYSDIPLCANADNLCVVYKRLSSKVWDIVMKENRCAPIGGGKNFNGYVESSDIVRYAFSHKDEKRLFNMNTDQSPYYNSGANVDIVFMHQKTKTMTGAAALASKFHMAVLYQNMRPLSRGHYVMEFTPICPDASQMSPESIMKRYYELLEKDINNTPENYLWTHRRWKI